MQKVWKDAPGRQAVFWRDCYTNNCIAVNWLNDLNLKELDSEAAFEETLTEYSEGGSTNARSLYSFVHEIKKGDLVVANDGRSKCRGIGVITSDYLPPNHRKNPFRNNDFNVQVRLVDWRIDHSVELPQNFFNIPTVQLLKPEEVTELKLAYLTQARGLTHKINDLIPLTISADEATQSQNPRSSQFVPDESDERAVVTQQVRARRGQQAFREALVKRYGGKCLVTGCELLDIFEAAHINPYKGTKDNHVENGILLRSDIHTLFDLEKLGIEPETFVIRIADDIAVDEYYAQYAGTKLRLPRGVAPSKEALAIRFQLFLAQNSAQS